MYSAFRRLACLLPIGFAALSPAAVVLDGSLGPKGALTGPKYSLDATRGKRVGSNLFYSFSDFSLNKGEVASFSSHVPVKNVLARVTGGTASNIDGTLQVTIPNASFYLISPAGLIFGPDAKLDLKGSFAITTADYVRLGSNGKISARADPVDSLLTSEAPVAFGFLSTRPGSLVVQQAELRAKDAQTVSLIAGNISLAGAAHVLAPSGRVNLVSVQSPGEVTFNQNLFSSIPDTTSFLKLGRIDLHDNSGITTNGLNGGQIIVRAADVLLTDHAVINAETTQGGSGGGLIDVRAKNFTINSDTGLNPPNHISSFLSVGNFGAAHGARIDVRADSILLNTHDAYGGFVAENGSNATGTGGSISVHAATLSIQTGGEISVTSLGAADCGQIEINAKTIVVDGPFVQGGDVTGIVGQARAGGHAGDITISSAKIEVKNGANISVFTDGSGRGGDVHIHSKSITVDGASIDATTSDAGQGGDLSIDTDRLSIVNGADISAQTTGPSQAGNIHLRAAHLVIDDASIDAETSGMGKGGGVQIRGGSVHIRNGGAISARTSGPGQGGDLDVQIHSTIQLDRGLMTAETSSSGDGGSVTIRSNDLKIDHGASISASTVGSGNGGEVTLHADSSLGLNDGSISADTFLTGKGGSIFVSAGDIILLNASISSNTSGSGNGGTVSVSTSSLRLHDGGTIRASAAADSSGQPGSVVVNADSIVVDSEGLSDRTGIFADSFGAQSINDRSVRVFVRVQNANLLALVNPQGVESDFAIPNYDPNSFGLGQTYTFTAATFSDSTRFQEPTGDGPFADHFRTSAYAGSSLANLAIASRVGKWKLEAFDIAYTEFGLPAPSIPRIEQFTLDLSGKRLTTTTSTPKAPTVDNPDTALRSALIDVSAADLPSLPASRSQVGGSVQITARSNLTLRNGGKISASSTGGRDAGDIIIHAKDVFLDQATIATQSSAAGAAGNILIRAHRVEATDGDTIAATSKISPAGEIQVLTDANISVFRSGVTTKTSRQGGTIVLRSLFGDINLRDATITSEAGERGDITIDAAKTVLSNHSIITARAQTTGGQISIDPPIVVLNHTTVDGRHGPESDPVKVTIAADSILIRSFDTSILADQPSLPPDVDIVQGLANLDAAVVSGAARLQESCAQRFTIGGFSSFVVEGSGGLSLEPGTAMPSFLIKPPTTQRGD